MRNSLKRPIVRAVLLASVAISQSNATESTFQVADLSASAPSPAELDRAVTMAASYLEKALSPEGKFAYRIETSTGLHSSSYNVVRHAGAMYALGMFNRTRPDAGAVDALVRAARYLRQTYIGPGPQSGQLVLWAKPQPSISNADLGGTGLGLAAFAEVNRAKANSVPLEEMAALGRFALSLQKEDGSFYSRYRGGAGPDEEWESLYYPGEAALGFIELYEEDHSRGWLVAAGRALAYLARSRAGLANVPPDHWALIATARLLPHCTEDKCPASREALIGHAVQVCRSLLRGQMIHPAFADLDGAFDPAGRTAPVATRLEGLLAALEFLPKQDMALRAEIEEAAQHGIAFLLRAQIHSGPYAGGIPGALIVDAKGSSEVRIDFVQHALCAWLRYKTLLRATVSAGKPIVGR